MLTDAYSMMWPAAPHRVLTSCVAAASRSEREPVGETTLGGVTFPVHALVGRVAQRADHG